MSKKKPKKTNKPPSRKECEKKGKQYVKPSKDGKRKAHCRKKSTYTPIKKIPKHLPKRPDRLPNVPENVEKSIGLFFSITGILLIIYGIMIYFYPEIGIYELLGMEPDIYTYQSLTSIETYRVDSYWLILTGTLTGIFGFSFLGLETDIFSNILK